MHRQAKALGRNMLSHGKVAGFITQIGKGALQMKRYRIIGDRGDVFGLEGA